MSFALRNWRAIGAAIVIVGLLVALALSRSSARHWQKVATGTQAAFDRTVADYRLAAEKTRADDLVHARAIETRDTETTKDHEDALLTQLADARRIAADYARRLRAGATATDPGGDAGADRAGAAIASVEPDVAGRAAILDDDIRVCSENTVKAAGWQAWWAEVSAGAR